MEGGGKGGAAEVPKSGEDAKNTGKKGDTRKSSGGIRGALRAIKSRLSSLGGGPETAEEEKNAQDKADKEKKKKIKVVEKVRAIVHRWRPC